MSSRSTSTLLQRLTLAYKINRFPWKKHVLVGLDLKGNEFWEMPSPLGGRVKRWVQMKESSDYSVYQQDQLPVQWQAWLRHTRPIAPTLEELAREEQRKALVQERAKALELEWEQRKLRLQDGMAAEASHSEPEPAKPDEEPQSQPAGQGDTFVPGAWSPNRVRQR